MRVPYDRLRTFTEIAVSGRLATALRPDLTVLAEEAALALDGATQQFIHQDMPLPALVVEVVSSHLESREYRYQRTEYAGRHIPEYWIVGPIAAKVTILDWVDDFYEGKGYQGEENVVSRLFANLNLIAVKLLSAAR